jgi:GTP cyclohydrolase I
VKEMDETVVSHAENIVRALLHAIGEDVRREGLLDTPKRIVRSWEELFAGYKVKDIGSLITTFTEAESYDEIVLLRNIEFFSFCEHHMLPFSGVGHVAYLPGKKVVGISKLARILDVYARRLQIQERIGQQVVQAITKHLEPKGAACILVARHGCMVCRGVKKQNSEMVTSSLTGVFKEKAAIRTELLALIGTV